MQLNELRKDLQFNKDLLGLVETLKNVAGAQFHLMEKQKKRFEFFMDAFAGFFRVVDLVAVPNPLVSLTNDRVGLVIITSDSGFMGGLNSQVIQAGLDEVADVPRELLSLVVIGDKGSMAMGDRGYEFKSFPGINHEAIYEHAVALKDYLVAEIEADRMGRVVVVHPRALSFSRQDIDVVTLLPCTELFDHDDAESEIAPYVSKLSLVADARKVLVESSFEEISRHLAGVWVTSKLYEVFEDSKLAEFSARAMHLEGSLEKVEIEHKKIRRQVFKATHEKIDKGMRESFSAKSTKGKRRRAVNTE